MNDPLAFPTITSEQRDAARELFAGRIADCPHCGGWSKPDPRRAPIRYDTAICLSDARDTWYVRCFSCYACTSSTLTAADAVERWNRRPSDHAATKTRSQIEAELKKLKPDVIGDSTFDAGYCEALEWALDGAVAARQPELLPLVDLRELADRCGLRLDAQMEDFAQRVQRAALSLNRRPVQ
jgi:hypothetical protein